MAAILDYEFEPKNERESLYRPQTMFVCDLVMIHPLRTGPHIPYYKVKYVVESRPNEGTCSRGADLPY